MHAAGLSRGAYQFFRASEDPLAQADLVLSSLRDAGGLGAGDLPVVMDVETSDGQSNDDVRARMASWLDAVAEGSGKKPMVYTNAATSSAIGTGFGQYPLWVAAWESTCPSLPAGWSSWVIWQYAATGTVAGIAGAVDLDELDGTLGDLAALGRGPLADAADTDAETTDAMGGDAAPNDAPVIRPPGAGTAMGGTADASSPRPRVCLP
jgi:lysozyme